jgi:predicted SAM-dependent methyltransferase
MLKLWKRLPISLRSYLHVILHRFNTSKHITSFLLFRHLLTARKLKLSETPVQLRIGESRKFEGWISTNYQILTRQFMDATKSYGINVCEFIFADNVIEHLEYSNGERLIEQAFKALIPGGVLRLTTPDLETIAERYLTRSQRDLAQFAEDLREHNVNVFSGPDLLRITFTSFGHHKGFIYDFQTLGDLLSSKGFCDVVKQVPGESGNPKLRGLETRTKPSDMWSQMAVEATKPIK